VLSDFMISPELRMSSFAWSKQTRFAAPVKANAFTWTKRGSIFVASQLNTTELIL